MPINKPLSNLMPKNTRLLAGSCLTGLLLLSVPQLPVWAHSEHDKARFVAEDGKDDNNCANRFRPCKTIGYALLQAKKGDKILVAEGSYPVSSPSELLQLNNLTNPVFAGYSTTDNYQVQNPEKNATTLVGVPPQYRALAQKKGFHSIVDSKSEDFDKALHKAETQYTAMQQRQQALTCENGMADEFSCDSIDLVSHVPLADFSTGAASDIWGHVDLNTGIEYAIMGLRDGVAAINLADPANPVVVGKITQQSTTWRDIKVYQYFDTELNLWQAYAYVTADNASVGLTILDLNDLPNTLTVANTNSTDTRAHNVYISNVDYSLNIALNNQPGLHILGQPGFSGAMRTYSLADPTIPTAAYTPTSANALLYTHDASSVNITDARAAQCSNANEYGCTVMLDFNEAEFRLWDHTDIDEAQQLSTTTYDTASYVHSGWWSEDRNYIFVHDELDERNRGMNSTLYVYDITDLTSPQRVGTWTGTSNSIDHNGFVRGNRYYMSNYESGLTILDITDPSTPITVGYFDTYPIGNAANFRGAWGVYPYLPSGLVLVSDINSGLYVFKDNTRAPGIGFASARTIIDEGETAEVTLTKDFTGATSVAYEVISGSTNSSDYVIAAGNLDWTADENDSRTISITALEDDNFNEPTESLFIRLLNPTNGASLNDTFLTEIKIRGAINYGKVNFASNNVAVLETQGSGQITVNRLNGNEQAISIDYALTDSEQTDLILASGSLSWADGDSTPQTIAFDIVNDEESEQTESYQLQISADNTALLGDIVTIDIVIRDDESNQAPEVNSFTAQSHEEGDLVEITATGADPEGDNVTWQWSQISGPDVTLNDADTDTVFFTMPGEDVVLQATASDDFGVTSSQQITVAFEAPTTTTPTTPPATPAPSGGGGSLPLWYLIFGGLAVWFRRNSRN